MAQRPDTSSIMTRLSEPKTDKQKPAALPVAQRPLPERDDMAAANRPTVQQPDWLLVLTITFFLMALLIIWLVGVPALLN